jgi:uncharacterized protein YcnI
MKTSHKLISAATLATLAAGLSLTPANAHIGIRPGVDSAGSTVSAITAGQAGVLVFRVGHGCTVEEENLINPNTGKSFLGTKWGTHSLSVDIPVVAQGTGTTVPKPQYVPGFKTSISKNSSTGVYTVTWTAISREFDIPDGPAVSDPSIAANLYADFGVSIKWAADQSGKTVYFKTVQTCLVDIPAKKKTKKTKSKPATVHKIFNSWDVVDGSGADKVPDNTEHNTAPSVTVK